MEQSYLSLKTAEGYTAHILRAGDTYGAIVMDNTIARCCQVFEVPVKVGFPFSENAIIPLEINPKHVHLLCASGQRVLFIGRLGLHGGGHSQSCSGNHVQSIIVPNVTILVQTVDAWSIAHIFQDTIVLGELRKRKKGSESRSFCDRKPRDGAVNRKKKKKKLKRGKKVDVVTTSTELSKREVERQRAFFEMLQLTVDENSSGRDKKTIYSCDVVYGTASDFQGDILRTEFLGNDCRGNRKFEVVIVDEVDSMLFDSRSHSVRLADQCPGMTHLEVPLAVVWQFIHHTNQHMISKNGKVYFIAEDFEVHGHDVKLLSGENWLTAATEVDDKKEFIIEHGQKHLQKLLRELAEDEKCEYQTYQDLNLKILAKEQEISLDSSNDQLKKECDKLRAELFQLPWNRRHPIIDIPEHLRAFALTQIPSWIKNAIQAAWGFQQDAHYAVMNGKIVPIYFKETGVLQSNMVWSDGLTQFLQLKEGLCMDPEAVSTNFISNVSFFNRYGSNVFGLTGTLGEESTQQFLRSMYGTDMVIIPPHKQVEIHNNQDSPYRCKELMPLVCPNVGMWYKTIKENALYHASSNRGVLIIWQYIFQVEHICNMLKKVYDPEKIHKYTGTDATFDKTTIDSGEIILATNIAGRGTDFKTSQEVEHHGGMCVIVTFLPESNRVEMQNVGRTAREGKRGMAQLIVLDKNNTPMDTLKTLRSLNETEADEKATDEAKRMLVQDALFQRFCTLENKFLPSHDVVRNVQLWNLLQINWAIFSSDHLNARKIAEESRKLELKTIKEYINKMKGKKLEMLTKEEIDTTVSEEVASMKPKFEALYIQSKRNEFCQQQSSHMPKELIDCFRANKAYEPFITKDARDFKWTLYDRKGAEESWGMWLKSKHFVENEATEDQATKMFEEEFGNDALDRKDVEAAINCYDRAIQLDPTFSVNARYNKAQALLTYAENKLSRQDEAKKELQKAKDMITAGTCSEYASQHVQHQLNILSKQEEYIVRALEMLDQALKNKNNVKLTLKKMPTVLSEAKEDHGKAIQEAAQNGLTHLFMVEEELPRPWGSIISIAFIGISQIAAGCLIVACTGGALGTGLIAEGVSDMITSVRSAITGTFSWAAWAAQKVISLAVSIVCAGFSGIKSGMKAVVNTVKDLRKGVQMAKGGIELAVKEVSLAIGKGIVKECLTEGGKYCTDLTIMNKVEEMISQKVGERLTAALLKNDLIVAALKDDEANGSNYWKQKFISDGLDILKDERMNECLKLLKEIAKGIASRQIPLASDILTYSGVLVFLKVLMTYTEDFIKKFNKQVSNHRSEINSIAGANSNPQQTTPQSMLVSQTHQHTLISNAPNVDVEAEDIIVHTLQDDTSYSSKCTFGNKQLQSNYVEASTPESLANAFKSRIAGKLAASARESIVNPALSNATSFVTTKLFTSCENSVAELRKEIKTARDKRSCDNDLANTGRKQPDKQHKQEDLGEHSKKAIKELSTEGIAHDTTILALAAAETNCPIYVYDEKGNLKDVLGDNLSGDPISLIHSPPSEERPLGHFEPLNPNVEVTPSGINTCAFDSVFAQLSQEQKDSLKLNDPSDLRERLVQRINSNPAEAERAFSKRAELTKIASDRILRGGARKLPPEEKRKKQTKEQFDDLLHEMDYESDSHTVDEAVEQKKCQKHHILHRKFKNHPALVKANFHIDDPSNLIYLPISEEIRSECGTQRSIHRGRHSNLEFNRVNNGLDKIYQDATANNWSQQETFKAVFRFAMDGRTGLRKGIIDLYEKEQREE
ncbi:conserved hypothetical protein [Culex quinquefasciatus]|uniref:Uncharacterized protein n=1 Tax=Culex quinquefasciatus TaxID=7176 RepID=B0X8Y0_CULQU|nr:conserved hypothetical protein [Culex quinquefasciatus]|eukprot:XP_001866102.1 conserved hypothetical protein [Culex quinquefasciatus]